jgi:hypothetical protein
MGIDPEALVLASFTSYDEISTPDAATMLRLRITNNDVQFSGWTIVPARAGAVVTGTLNDPGNPENQKIQFTLFCRHSDSSKVFLLASGAVGFGYADRPVQSNDVRAAVFGSKLKIGQTTVREQDGLDGITDAGIDDSGRYYFVYALSADEFNRGLQAGFTVVVDVPHVWSQSSDVRFQPPVQGLRQLAAIAFKSCL